MGRHFLCVILYPAFELLSIRDHYPVASIVFFSCFIGFLFPTFLSFASVTSVICLEGFNKTSIYDDTNESFRGFIATMFFSLSGQDFFSCYLRSFLFSGARIGTKSGIDHRKTLHRTRRTAALE